MLAVFVLSPFILAFADAGYALAFDGSNDVVKLAETYRIMASTWTTTKTVELWVKPEGPSLTCRYPVECDSIFGDKPIWWGITRGVYNGQDRIWVFNVDGNADFIGIPYTAGEWVHIALVHNGGVLRAYKNGVEVGNKVTGMTAQPPPGAYPVLYLGGVIVTNTRYYTFQGQIDEVRVWNVARTPAELQANMLNELVGNEARLGSLLPDVGWEWADADRQQRTRLERDAHGWSRDPASGWVPTSMGCVRSVWDANSHIHARFSDSDLYPGAANARHLHPKVQHLHQLLHLLLHLQPIHPRVLLSRQLRHLPSRRRPQPLHQPQAAALVMR